MPPLQARLLDSRPCLRGDDILSPEWLQEEQALGAIVPNRRGNFVVAPVRHGFRAATICGMMFSCRSLLTLCVAALSIAVAPVQAQNPPPAAASEPSAPAPAQAPRSRRSSHVSEDQAMQWFNLLDANHDGCISRDEAKAVILIAPRLGKDFDEADANHDGCITPDEIRALAERRRVEREARRAAEAQQKATEKATAQPSAPEAASAP
jgi:pyruvate/2-oxoglutarate dehydrogenase complex dihydrolipoamide acyltransferase (E2) component